MGIASGAVTSLWPYTHHHLQPPPSKGRGDPAACNDFLKTSEGLTISNCIRRQKFLALYGSSVVVLCDGRPTMLIRVIARLRSSNIMSRRIKGKNMQQFLLFHNPLAKRMRMGMTQRHKQKLSITHIVLSLGHCTRRKKEKCRESERQINR